MRKILVTGGVGYIGSHTVVELLTAGDEVVIVDNLSNSNEVVLERIHQITGKKPIFHKLDILDKAALAVVFENHRFSTVIHFAGLKSVGESVSEPVNYYQNNVAGTLNLLQIMELNSCYHLVFSSSATVYGGQPTIPINENSPLSAINPYGQSKLFVENILMDLAAANKKWQIISLRYFNPVAAHPSALIGEHPNGIPNNLLPYVAQVAVGRLEKLSVFGSDYDTIDGTGVRDYIHVVDLAKAHLCAINAIEQSAGDINGNYAAYNVGTGKGYSVLEVIAAFEAASGKEIHYEIVDRRQGDVAECYAQTSLSEQKMHWKAEHNLDQMMQDHWRWQQQNPNGFE